MEIVALKKDDIKNALDLVWTVFEEFEAPDYSMEGVEEFKKFIAYDAITEKIDSGELHFWGCKDNGNLAGIIATRGTNHICMLFVKKEYQRQGIARNLFRTVKERCKDRGTIREITVHSSPYAVEVYRHLGFIDTDKELTVNGIRFTPMSCFI